MQMHTSLLAQCYLGRKSLPGIVSKDPHNSVTNCGGLIISSCLKLAKRIEVFEWDRNTLAR